MSVPQGDIKPISLLYVDNDVNVLDVLKKYFEHETDFSFFPCATPSEALGLIGQYQFDAIISDYSMPEMDGIAFLREVRAQNDQALFIIFTGRHLAQIAIETLNNGGNYYVQKGVDFFSDIQKIEEFIRSFVANRRLAHPAPDSDMRDRSLVVQQQDLLCCFQPDGTCTLANNAYASFIGKKKIEFPQTNFLAIIPKKEQEQIRKHLSHLTTQSPGTSIEHHVLNKKGEPVLFHWSYQAFFNDQGRVHEYLAQGRDLSCVVRLDEILPHGAFEPKAESTQHVVSPTAPRETAVAELATLADSIDQVQYPIFAIDNQGVVIAWNRAIAELTGIGARTIIGQGNYAYAFPIYGEPRPMLIDAILKAAAGQDIQLFPGITHDGDTYTSEREHVTIQGKPMQICGKGTPFFDGNGNVIAAVQSLLISEEPGEDGLFDATEEHYIGGVSSIALKVSGEGVGGALAGAIGSTTGGYGVYATDKRLLVVHNPELDASRNEGVQFGEFLIEELFGTNVDMSPQSIAKLEKIKVFEVWRNNITAIEMKTPRFLAGVVIIRTASGGSYRIYVDHKKAFMHLEQLLNLFYPNIIRMADELDDADLTWLNEIRELVLVDKLQLEDPFKGIGHNVTKNLPRIPILLSPSVSQGQCHEIAKSIENVPYPIFAIDLQGIVIAWNRAIARLTGIEPWEMIGKGDYEYACPIYGERKPMLIDYIIRPPDTRVQGELQAITREGDTFIGALENVTIRGTPMLIWGKGIGIYTENDAVIAAVQSILYSEQQPSINTIISTFEEEQYLGGLSSITVKVPGTGIAGAIAGALGSTTGGFGIYATDQRIFVIHNPELDATKNKKMLFGEFIINELFGTTVDTKPRSIEELGKMKVFEVARKDIIIIEMKKPLLFAGCIKFRIRSGETFRVYSDQKMAYFHLEQLFRLHYSEILRIE